MERKSLTLEELAIPRSEAEEWYEKEFAEYCEGEWIREHGEGVSYVDVVGKEALIKEIERDIEDYQKMICENQEIVHEKSKEGLESFKKSIDTIVQLGALNESTAVRWLFDAHLNNFPQSSYEDFLFYENIFNKKDKEKYLNILKNCRPKNRQKRNKKKVTRNDK